MTPSRISKDLDSGRSSAEQVKEVGICGATRLEDVFRCEMALRLTFWCVQPTQEGSGAKLEDLPE